MKSFLYKLSTQAAMTVVMLLMVFAPFGSLIAQAETGQNGSGALNQINSAQGSTQQTLDQIANDNSVSQGQALGSTPITAGGTATAGTNGSATPPAAQQTSTDILANCKQINVSGCIASMVYVFTVGIGSAFAYIAAYFFDITIQLSLNGASYGLDFVSTSWTTARDLANMAFLFILIYIAFTIILRADTSGTMSLLAGVIIVALLVNFSFFFSRVIIDAGNILTIQFYNAIPAPPISQTIQGTPVAGTVANGVSTVGGFAFSGNPANTKDLTASIMNMIQVQNLLNNNSFLAANSDSSGKTFTFNLVATIFIFIAAAIVLWILTVAFITNGVKFLVRVVVLWFLIVVSPFAFVAATVQGVRGKYFTQWRELLVTHAFYPVAFMFIFLILNNFAITISGSNTNLVQGVFSTGTGLSTWSAVGASIVSIAIRVGLVVAVLFVGMRASDKISVYGASAAGKAGNWFGGKFIGAYGAAGRNTFGWAANRASQNATFQNAAANNAFVRTLWRGTNTVGKSSFDVRAPLKAAGVKDVAGLNMGGVNKGGYKGAFDARVKAREEEAKKFNEPSDDAKNEHKQKVAEAKEEREKAQTVENNRARGVVEREVAPRKTKIEEDRTETNKNITETTKVEDAAKEKMVAAENEAKITNDKIIALVQHIDDLVKQGKQGTAEMTDAINKRKAAEAEHTVNKAKVVAAQQEVETHKTARTGLDSRIAELAKEQEALRKEIDQKVKAETKQIAGKVVEDLKNARHEYAEAIGKRGLGNLSRLGMWIPAADKKASKTIRKTKSEKDKGWEAIQKALKEEGLAGEKEEKKDEPAAAPKEDKKDDHR